MKNRKISDDWQTPKEIYDLLDKEFDFDFDPCPYHADFNGLSIEWGNSNFVNPPYSQTEQWILKALNEYKKGKIVVLLLRLDASTKWFRDLILPNTEVRIFEDRLHFIKNGKASRSNHASILAILNNSNKRLNCPIIYWRKPKENKNVR